MTETPRTTSSAGTARPTKSETTTPAHGGNPSFSDPGTTSWYGPDDVIGNPAVTFSQAGGHFRTETITVSVSLNEAAESGWYQIEGASRVNLSKGEATTFTLGADMAYDSSKTVSWGAVNAEGSLFEGSYSFTNLDPASEATYTLTFQDESKNWQNVNCYVWDAGNGLRIYVQNGLLAIDSDYDSEITVTGIDGMTRTFRKAFSLCGSGSFHLRFSTERVNFAIRMNSLSSRHLKSI